MRTAIPLILLSLLTACGDAEPEAPPAPEVEAPKAEAPPAKKHKGKKGKKGQGKVFFVEPKDGATVKSPVKLVFGVKGMEVNPAGELKENTGHHHLIIDAKGIKKGEVVPKDEQHIHYGGGQTEASVEMSPGTHTLTMQFADGEHHSYGGPMATTITITVEE